MDTRLTMDTKFFKTSKSTPSRDQLKSWGAAGFSDFSVVHRMFCLWGLTTENLSASH